MRKRQLTAYGEQSDQDKLTVLAEHHGITQSTWIVRRVREEYARLFGEQDPRSLLRNNE